MSKIKKIETKLEAKLIKYLIVGKDTSQISKMVKSPSFKEYLAKYPDGSKTYDSYAKEIIPEDSHYITTKTSDGWIDDKTYQQLNEVKQTKLRKSFLTFLKTHFKSFKDFKKKVSKMESIEIKMFYANIKRDIMDNGNYKKHLRFNNYTIDKNRMLIMIVYNHFFSNVPKRKGTLIIIKGVEAASYKTPNKRKREKGTDAYYKHSFVVPLNEVTRFFKYNGGRLRAEVGQDWDMTLSKDVGKNIKFDNKVKKPDSVYGLGVFKSYKVKKVAKSQVSYNKGGMSAILREYGYITSFAFKYAVHTLQASKEKVRRQRAIANKRRRADKFSDGFKQDWSLLLDFIRKTTKSYIFSEDFSAEARKEMTIAFKILKLKKYKDFTTLITSKSKWDRATAKDLAGEFIKAIAHKKKTYKHIK